MDVLSQVAQNNAARTEAAKYNADRNAVAHWNAIQDARRAEAGRVLNQGTPTPNGLAGLRAEAYAEGLSPEDAYRISQVKAAQDANYDRAVEQMRNAQITNGKIDPVYWEAAQKASDYELSGLAGRGIK